MHLDESTSRPPSVAPPPDETPRGAPPAVEPIGRRTEGSIEGDPPARATALRARIRTAAARGEADVEATASSRLARHLIGLDQRLDEAVVAGRRAIALTGGAETDPELRRMIATTLQDLGEPSLAAAALRPLVDARCAQAARDPSALEEAVSGLLRLGDLLLRSGDVDGALESFRYVTVVAPDRPEGQERVAIARGIAPTAVSAETAARAYIGAAKKHQLAGDDARAMEDLARAFECDPGSTLAAAVFADALEDLGRPEAADAVRAEHAYALGHRVEEAALTHALRREKAQLRGDAPAMLATVLDELVELVVHTDPGSPTRADARGRLDAALREVPALANARMRLDALLSVGAAAAAAWRAIAEASSTPAAGRLEAWAEVVARDLADDRALSALREHARAARDPRWIVEALVRALRAPILVSPELWAARAAELALWAEEHLDDPLLAAWSWRRIEGTSAESARAHVELVRLAPRVEAVEATLRAARETARSEAGAARLEALRTLARACSAPDEAPSPIGVLAELLAAQPDDRLALAALERVAGRMSPEDAAHAHRLREEAATDPGARAHARLARVELALRRGDVAGARQLLADAEPTGEFAALRVALAERVGGPADLGAALADLPAPTPKERAVCLAAAARACRLAGMPDVAASLAERALRADPRDLRGAFELAELAVSTLDGLPAALAGASLERALGGIGARARWALALAAYSHRAGEVALAAAWTRRAWSLRPGDVDIARLWLQRAIALADAELVAEVVLATTALVPSLGALASDLGLALRCLMSIEPGLGERVLEALLREGAARIAPLREIALDATHERPRLAVKVLERWLASGVAPAERAAASIELAERALAADDLGRAADAVSRAMNEPALSAPDAVRVQTIVERLAARPHGGLPADAELVVREMLARRQSAEVQVFLTRSTRVRPTPEQESSMRAAAEAYRVLGRDRWDLAGDHDGALRAWLRGALLLGGEGLDRIEADIAHFGGDAAVRDALLELARRVDLDDGGQTGPLGRARVRAFQVRAWQRAIERPPPYVEPVSLAREAMARSPDPASLLPAIERLTQAHRRGDTLNDLYDLAAGRAVGRYGERGIRYRAARVLDRGGRPDEAMQQAVRAFSAVPSEGAILVLLERLARTTQRADLAIAALVEAAEQADDADRRATWLDRAAAVAHEGVEDPADRVDLLLRLFLTAPSARTGASLIEAIRGAVANDPLTKDTLVQRLRRAHRKVDGKLGYVDRLPVLGVVAGALAELDSVQAALDLVGKGVESTPRRDLGPLREAAESIAARDPEAARAWLERNPGGDVIRAHVAWGAGDPDRAVEELAAHVSEPDDFDLGESTAEAPAEIALLEKWAPSVRDKRALAQAWTKLGRRGGVEAELETARALDESGQTEQAARTLIVAWQARNEIEPETLGRLIAMARDILPHAGVYAELIDMLVDDLERHPSGDVADRVARWREIADLRANRLGDRVTALDALIEAGRALPGDEELWNEISDLAEAVGAHDRLVAALAQRLQRARPERRVQLLRRLARVLEHDLGRDSEAAERWAELVRLLPLDSEAADALERIAERRSDRVDLLELLRARAGRLPVGHPDRTRALRRLARELEGAVSRRGEVLSAIREVHQQVPGDAEVALQLARLARAAGDVGTAAEALMRAFRAASNTDKARLGLAVEAARALIELHDYDTAGRLMHEAIAGTQLASEPRALELLRLMLEIAIARGDAREEALTRVRIAEIDVEAPPGKRAANCAAAARALTGLGEHERAREMAWTAARAAPSDVSTVALVAELEFALGVGRTPGGALPQDHELLQLLTNVSHDAPAPPETLSVVAFARAELLDAVHSAGAGYRDLHGWPEEVRPQPLVQLAFAERLAAEWSFAQATAAYERAFAGDLRGLRAIGPSALRAADAAARSNDPTRARHFLDLAARDPACRIDARKRAVDLARTLGDHDAALRALQRLAAEATGNVRATALAEQARLLRAKDPEAAVETMKLAVQASQPASTLRQDLERELTEIDQARAAHSLPPAPPPALRDSASSSRMGEGRVRDAVLAQLTRPEEIAPPLPIDPPSVMSTDPQRVGEAPASSKKGGKSSQRWLAAHSTSEPPPQGPPTAKSRHPPPLAREESDSAARAIASIPPPPPPPPTDAGADAGTNAGTDGLSEHPRLTMVDAPPAMAVPGLPRPAGSEHPPLDLEALGKIALDAAAPAAERIRALKTLGEAAHEAGRSEESARHYISALELGDVAAGDGAAELLAAMPDRAGDLLLVRRRQAFLAPGDPNLLDALHAAVQQTRDHVFARAVDHVRRAFDPIAGPVPPPPLDMQLDRPDLVVPLLERRASPVAAEALRLVWDSATTIFRKDLGAYGMTSLERVNAASTIGKVVAASQRLLGMSRTAVFLRQRAGRDVEAVLLSPTAVVLGGDCKDDGPETRYLLGVGLMAAHPSHCLLLAQPEPQARATWQALLAAFGPPEHGRGVGPEIGRLAASLWQTIPRAAQRRLGELLGATPPTFEVALEGARQVARRCGLYLSGDLHAAVRATLAESGDVDSIRGRGPNELVAAAQSHPLVADLVRLATSPEFAEARWRHVQPGGRRRTPSASGNQPPPSSGR